MIVFVYLIIAIILLTMGHMVKIHRWKQFLKIYEEPDTFQLLNSLAIGYAVNFFIPFRAGDFIRAALSGRKLKNGISFSLSTIILEHCLDIPAVFVVFLFLWQFGPSTNIGNASVITYCLLTILIVLFVCIGLLFNKYIKLIAKSVCSIFNQYIKYSLLFFIYSFITSFKDLLFKISKLSLVLYTGCIWSIYLLSYFFLTQAIISIDSDTSFSQVFTSIFSRGGFSLSNFALPGSFALLDKASLIIVVYIISSIMLLPIVSVFFKNKKLKQKGSSEFKLKVGLNLLPWINEQDNLNFFEIYFSGNRSENFKSFIALNRDISIIHDFSSGSHATTVLAVNGTATFYRKYVYGRGKNKLCDQIQWLHTHADVLPLPVILNERFDSEYCIYDMEYNVSAVNMFNFVHSTSSEESWNVLKAAIDLVRENLHTINLRPADHELINIYIEEKVHNNIEKIVASKEFRHLLESDTIIINGKSYKNLKYLKRWLERPYLEKVFSNDTCSDIHGDLTIENFIYFKENNKYPFYYIDPNTGNIHDSPFLDYAKLLQSLHGGYEFLVRTNIVTTEQNEIIFNVARTTNYADIYSKYRAYLDQQFTFEQIRSIYFHQIVHWLRLLPIKLEKNTPNSVLFLASFIIIFNEIAELYCDPVER